MPELVLLVFHIINQDFLVRTHVLYDEIVVCRVWQVSSRVIAVGRGRSRLGSRLVVWLILPTFTLIEHFRGAVCGSRSTLAHQAGPALRVHATSFVEKDLVVARRV